MLDFFTDPYPNELLFSAISRYNYYSGNKNSKETNYELFETRNIKRAYYYNFNFFMKRLAKNLGGLYSLKDFICNNTLVPYFATFYKVSPNLNFDKLCLNKELFYCPKCAQEDIEKYGEAYFHREHQIRHISICYKHRTKIIKYKHGAVWRRIDDYHKFNIGNINVDNIQFLDNSEYDNLHKISKLSYDLLINNFNYVNSQTLTNYYINKLYQKGFLKINRAKVNYDDLKNELINFYGKNTISLLNENLRWVYDINKPRKLSVLNHLLLLNFLGLSINEFIYEINNFDDIESMHYKKEILKMIEINPNISDSKIKSTLIYSYPQILNNETWLKVNGYIEKFQKLKNSKTKIIEFIHTKPETNRSEIRKLLKIEYNYVYRKDKTWIEKNVPTQKQIPVHEMLNKYKQDIEECMQSNPGIGRTKIREILGAAYNYVYSKDKAWIEKNVPTQRKVLINNEKLNYYKQNIEECMQSNPGIGRTKIREILGAAYNYVYSKDKTWMENNVPDRRKIVINNEKLNYYKQNIEEYVQSNPGICRTKLRETMGTEYNYVYSKDKIWIDLNIPISRQALTNDNLASYKKRIYEFLNFNPNCNRTKLKAILITEYNYVYKNDKKWIEKYVPTEKQLIINRRLTKYKQDIEKCVKLNPGIGRTKIRELITAEYNYVYKKDKVWIEKHVPKKSVNPCN